MDDVTEKVALLAQMPWLSLLSALLTALAFLFTNWEQRRKRLGIFVRHQAGPREEREARYEINVQNFTSHDLSGPIVVALVCGGSSSASFESVKLYAGPRYNNTSTEISASRSRVVVKLDGIDALRTVSFEARAACPISVHVRGDDRADDEPEKSASRLGSVWPQPLTVATGTASSGDYAPRQPSWWLYVFIMLGGLSVYWLTRAVTSDRGAASDGWEELALVAGVIGLFALAFRLLRREPIPVARGYRDGRELVVPSAHSAAN